MIDVTTGPLIIQPAVWTLVFSKTSPTWWCRWLAFGKYKHVRAYAYVPFLHVWVFYDVHLAGTDIIVAADGDAAMRQIGSWIADADLVNFRAVRREGKWYSVPLLGFCVPAMCRLIGLPGSALLPTSFFRQCLAHGGHLIEERTHGNSEKATSAGGAKKIVSV